MNESRYDVAEIRGGRVADAVQVKFVGADAKECLTLLHSNVCAVISGDKDADAALRDVAKDTASGAEAGQAIIPVPVVEAVVGSVVGYAVSGEVFRRMKMFLDKKELAREERLRVEREYRESVKALEEFRAKAESVVSQCLAGSIKVFREAFGVMDEAMRLGDVDGYIFGANMLARRLGGVVQFENMREFDALMMSDEAFVL